MTHASNLTGEVTSTLAGTPYILKPTFAALMRIEAEAGMSILQLAADALEGGLKLSHVLLILKHCMAEAPSEAELGEMLLKEGLAKVMPSVHSLMAVVLEGTLRLDD